MARLPPLFPWLLLVSIGALIAGDEAVSAFTGWPLDWSYAVAQAAGWTCAWLAVAWLVVALQGGGGWRRFIRLHPPERMAVACCCLGAVESMMRIGCISWLMGHPEEMEALGDQNVCDAVTGLNISGASIAALAVVAAFMAAMDAASKRTDAGASE